MTTPVQYGCTHATCWETFDNREDWKAHENRHARPRKQLYHCNLNLCVETFQDSEKFHLHLQQVHNIKETKYHIREGRCGPNWQERFWCGFCGDIFEVQTKALEAWTERNLHVGEHFEKGMEIGSWIIPESKQSKRQTVHEETWPQ
jgi:hypothetical protein